ncbi:MAG: hypothetical protein Q9218_003793 [Villophora microphyllina]
MHPTFTRAHFIYPHPQSIAHRRLLFFFLATDTKALQSLTAGAQLTSSTVGPQGHRSYIKSISTSIIMTEPEELDEDLFADLYDADEPAATTVPPAQSAPEPEPEPSEPAPLAADAPPPNDIGQDGNYDSSAYMTDQNQNGYNNGQDDRENYNDGRGSRMDVVAEQESGGIGIKEDG